MNKSDQQLDQRLGKADQRLVTSGLAPCGADIRRRAAQRQEARQQKNRVLVAVMILGCVLIGWRLLMPTPNQLAVPVGDINTTELLAEVEDLRQQRQQIDDQLALLETQIRLREMEISLRRLEHSDPAPETTYQRHRNTWYALQHLVSGRKEAFPDSDRWQLEMLANGFPDTTAGKVAQSILVNNETPDSFFEKLNEL